jgi:alkanesulfonate monooxygenase SsuD/methylene tetrahydromethanopterin reductase-like flavin-dependent oxidoreductase (luciferase family)
MTYEQLYSIMRIVTGWKDEQLDAMPIDDLEDAAERGVAAAQKWLRLRGLLKGENGKGDKDN